MSIGCKTYGTILCLSTGKSSVDVLHLVRANAPRKYSSAEQRLGEE